MRNGILLLVLMLLFTQMIQAAAPVIEGAFGIKLGDVPNIEYQKGEVYTKVGRLYFIDPPVKNAHFNEYAVLVTNMTNKIYSIYAEKEQTAVDCRAELLKVKTSLEKLYGTLSEENSIYSVKQNTREINLTCKVNLKNPDNSSLQIKYIDHQIYEDSISKPDPSHRDPSGL